MLKIALAVAILLAAPVLAQAKAFKLGDDDPVSWITIPDTWEPETFDNGVEGTSPDKETYVAAEIVAGKDLAAAGEDEDKFFAKQKIKIDESSKVEKKTDFNGLPGYEAQWNATDSDGPTHVSITLIKVADDKLLMLTYWGSEKGETTNLADLAEIAKSVRPIR